MSLPKISLAVLAIACVYTKQVQCASGSSLPATEGQLKFLALQLCRELVHFRDKPKEKACQERFLHPQQELANAMPPAEIQKVCQSQEKVIVSATEVSGLVLVALLPEEKRALIKYKVLTENKPTESISLLPESNYTLWTARLDPDGTPSLWHKGPGVPWIEDPDKDYEIIVGELKFEYRITNDLEATFDIVIEGVPSACADVTITNVCQKFDGPSFVKTTKLINQTIAIKNIPTNDECTLSVLRGKQRVDQKYQTPLCEELPGCMPHPEQPKNITLKANGSDSSVGWDVLVTWDKPRCYPEKYNVTLLGEQLRRTVLLEGNTSEVLFSGIDEVEGLYNVTIEAISSNGWASNTARAFFTAGGGGGGGGRSLALCGAALLLLLLALLLCCRARQKWYDEEQYKAYFASPQEIAQRKEFYVDSSPPVDGDSWEVKPEQLLMYEVLGEGAFGVVRRGTLKPEGKQVAVKMLKEFPTLEEHRAFRKEMELMKTVGAHPHVVSLVGCCHGRSPRIVVEYCSRGDLLSFLRCSWDVMVSRHNVKYANNIKININKDENTNYRNDLFTYKPKKITNFTVNKMYDLQKACDSELTNTDLLSFCRQIAMGMEFLASNRLVHRDLAARNVLVTSDMVLKIADFGLSRDVYQDNQYKQEGNGKMPVKWMALESLTHRIYTTLTDVWSFGVVMWEIVSLGATPYPDMPTERLTKNLRAGYRLPRPHYCPEKLYELMLECWSARPKQRPSFAELHVKLDALLNNTVSEDYITFEGEEETVSAKPKGYLMMLLKGHLFWSWGDHYELPWKNSTNHYTKTPTYHSIPV